MGLKKTQELRKTFLEHLKDARVPTTVYLTNGVKLSGFITWVDGEVFALSRDGITQLVMLHAVATVMPQDAFKIHDIMKGE